MSAPLTWSLRSAYPTAARLSFRPSKLHLVVESTFAKDLDAVEKARNDARVDQFHAFLDVYELTQSLNISSALDPGAAAIAMMADQIVDGLNLSG